MFRQLLPNFHTKQTSHANRTLRDSKNNNESNRVPHRYIAFHLFLTHHHIPYTIRYKLIIACKPKPNQPNNHHYMHSSCTSKGASLSSSLLLSWSKKYNWGVSGACQLTRGASATPTHNKNTRFFFFYLSISLPNGGVRVGSVAGCWASLLTKATRIAHPVRAIQHKHLFGECHAALVALHPPSEASAEFAKLIQTRQNMLGWDGGAKCSTQSVIAWCWCLTAYASLRRMDEDVMGVCVAFKRYSLLDRWVPPFHYTHTAHRQRHQEYIL